MIEVRQTETFRVWLEGLRDRGQRPKSRLVLRGLSLATLAMSNRSAKACRNCGSIMDLAIEPTFHNAAEFSS